MLLVSGGVPDRGFLMAEWGVFVMAATFGVRRNRVGNRAGDAEVIDLRCGEAQSSGRPVMMQSYTGESDALIGQNGSHTKLVSLVDYLLKTD